MWEIVEWSSNGGGGVPAVGISSIYQWTRFFLFLYMCVCFSPLHWKILNAFVFCSKKKNGFESLGNLLNSFSSFCKYLSVLFCYCHYCGFWVEKYNKRSSLFFVMAIKWRPVCLSLFHCAVSFVLGPLVFGGDAAITTTLIYLPLSYHTNTHTIKEHWLNSFLSPWVVYEV